MKDAVINFFAAVSVGLIAGVTIAGWKYGTEMAELRADHSQQMLDIANAASFAARQALEQQQGAIARIAEIDREYTSDIEQSRSEIDSLRSAVATGERKLRVQASCTADSDVVPDATATAGVDDAAGARLTRSAERNYWILRDRITTITAQVSALQSYIDANMARDPLESSQQ